MAQFFSAIVFSLACVAAFAMIGAQLRAEWARIAAILSGRELEGARATTARIRIRTRPWTRPEPRRMPQAARAAA